MKHPFFDSRILSLYYALFWGVMCLGSIFLQTLWADTSFYVNVSESISIFLVFPILGASIWYLVRYNSFAEKNWARVSLIHFIAATVITGIWLYLSFIIAKAFDAQNYLYRTLPSKILSGYLLYVGYVLFFLAIGYYNSLKEKIEREAEMKSLIRDAELSALKSQINPHFLFNSLNSISSLTISNPEKAQEMVINLSTVLRYSLQHSQDEVVSLKEEMDVIRLYLSIEKIRFGEKLNPVYKVEEDCLKAEIPNMILQPLMENAIKYGVYEATEPVSILIACSSDEKFYHVIIENEYDAESTNNKGEGIGLKNIRQRLELIYGNSNLLRITDNKKTFKVELLIPQKK